MNDISVYLNTDEITEMLEITISDFKKYERYKNKDNQFDFFILEQPIWENYEQKIKAEA